MEQVRCGACGGELTAGDLFCGECGAPAPRPAPWPGHAGGTGNGTSAAMNAEAGEGAASPNGHAPFFEHERPRPGTPLSNATRYLCAAAYLDRGFANDVIGNLVAMRRAVVPSLNFDVGPVIRHSLRARKLMLARDLLLVVALLLGLYVFRLPTVEFLLIAVLLGVLLPSAHWRQRTVGGRVVYAIVIWVWLDLIGSLAFAIAISEQPPEAGFPTPGAAATAASRQELKILAVFGILLGVTWAIQFVFTQLTYRTLMQHLQLNAPPPGPASGPAEARINLVEGAQWGNITLYATEDPFIGTGGRLAIDGEVKEHWSIAVKLEAANPTRQPLRVRPGADGFVPIDPVELHQKIRERLLGLNDPRLPVNERIAALTVSDRLIGPGRQFWTSPLVDMSLITPYSHASGEAIEAVIRHPQSGLRYYQQVSVSDEGPPVTSQGQQVLEGVDQGVAVSVFVYAAVEGRMFYLQFVLTALPPIKPLYRTIDLVPAMSSGRFLGMTISRSLRTVFKAIAYLPVELGRALSVGMREWQMEQKALSTHGSSAGDFGALMSIRERGADHAIGSYLHELDVEKYNKIFQRLLLETVQDYLAEKGVDVSAFEGSANSVINGDVFNVGSVSGSGIQLGSGNVQRNTASSQSH